MTATVISFPPASKLRRNADGATPVVVDRLDEDHPATILSAQLAMQFVGMDDVIVIDALARVMVSLCAVAAADEADALDTAELIGKDIVELTRIMMAPDGEPLVEADI